MKVIEKITWNYGYHHVMVYRVLHSLCVDTQSTHFELNEEFKYTLFKNTGVINKQLEQTLKELSLIGVIHRAAYLNGYILLTEYVSTLVGKDKMLGIVKKIAPTSDVSEKDNIKERFARFIDFYNKETKKNFKATTWESKALKKFRGLIDSGYNYNDFKTVIKNMLDDENVDDKYITPEYVCRSDKFEKYFNVKPKMADNVYPSKIS